MIARPARVRIRRRNPWVLARRRLLGWNVRLLTRGLPDRMACGARHAYAHRLSVVSTLDGRRPTGPTRTTRRGQAAATVARDDRATVRARPARGQTRAGYAPPPRAPAGAASHAHMLDRMARRDTPRETARRPRPGRPPAGRICDGLWTTACWAHRPVVSVSPVVGPSCQVDPGRPPRTSRPPTPPADRGRPRTGTLRDSFCTGCGRRCGRQGHEHDGALRRAGLARRHERDDR